MALNKISRPDIVHLRDNMPMNVINENHIANHGGDNDGNNGRNNGVRNRARAVNRFNPFIDPLPARVRNSVVLQASLARQVRVELLSFVRIFEP